MRSSEMQATRSKRQARSFSATFAIVCAAIFFCCSAIDGITVTALARGGIVSRDAIDHAVPDIEIAKKIFANAGSVQRIERLGTNPPVYAAIGSAGSVGLIASTWEIAGSVGYSGRPIDILVGISPQAKITGAVLVKHNEPILTLGISTADIERYVQGFAGYDLNKNAVDAFANSRNLPPIMAGATVSTGVIRDAILRTARTVATGHRLVAGTGASIDRVTFEDRSWAALKDEGALANGSLSFKQAAEKFGPLANPLPATDKTFLDAWVALIDPPTIGQNLLGQQAFTKAVGSLEAGQAAILIASSGLHSHRGTNYLRTGVFDRIEVIQGSSTIKLKKDGYLRIDGLALLDAPKFKEISVFRIAPQTKFDPAKPFRVEITAERERPTGETAAVHLAIPYELPQNYIHADATPPELADEQPLWVSAWERKPWTIAFVVIMIACVGASFFVQEFFVRRPKLWLYGRYGFLLVTFLGLGILAKGQLSVVQVTAFLHSLVNGFHWETFLIEPVVFILWAFVALGLLFWGRGAYCGWLCPFGALQELLNEGAKKLGVKQIEVPFEIQERLWAVKYTLFVVILGLSFYSMEKALVLAEVEPFKTAIMMTFWRDWPFVAFALALLLAGLFIERFYCRYLCPLGAALAIPAKLKLFDWLHRRPQCGRECRFCETQCTVGAIDTLGRINPNECVLCLRCQVIMNDTERCVILQRRAARRPSTARSNNSSPPPATAKT